MLCSLALQGIRKELVSSRFFLTSLKPRLLGTQALGVPATEQLSATPPGGHPAVSPSMQLPAAGAMSAKSSWPVRSLRLDTVSPLAALEHAQSKHSDDGTDDNGSGGFGDTSFRSGLVLLPLHTPAGNTPACSTWEGGRWSAVLCSRNLAGLPVHQLYLDPRLPLSDRHLPQPDSHLPHSESQVPRSDSRLPKSENQNSAAQPITGVGANGSSRKGVRHMDSSSSGVSRLEHGVAVDFSTARGDTVLMAIWLAARVARAQACLQRLQRLATATVRGPDVPAQHSNKDRSAADDRNSKMQAGSKSAVVEDVEPQPHGAGKVSGGITLGVNPRSHGAKRVSGDIGLGATAGSSAVFRMPGCPAVSIEAASLTSVLLTVQLASSAESASAAVEPSDAPSAGHCQTRERQSEGQQQQQLLVVELRWEQPNWDRDRCQAGKHGGAPPVPIFAAPEAISRSGGSGSGARCRASACVLTPPAASSATVAGQLSSLLKDYSAGASQHHVVVICMLIVHLLLYTPTRPHAAATHV